MVHLLVRLPEDLVNVVLGGPKQIAPMLGETASPKVGARAGSLDSRETPTCPGLHFRRLDTE